MKARKQEEPWPQLDPLPDATESIDPRYSVPQTVAREERDFDWRGLRWHEVYDIWEEHMPPGFVLDVGAGFGDFLRIGRDRGWDVTGLEISKPAMEYADKRWSIDLRRADTFAWRESAFDAVSCAFTLEHLTFPRAMVDDIYRSLKQGGMAYFAVPNDFSDFQRCSPQPEREWWVAPQHANYFDFETLTSMVEAAGFEVVDRLTSFPMEMFLMMGEDYVKRPDVGRACHWKRRAFDQSLSQRVRLKFYRALASAGIGRTAELIVKKP